MMRRSGTGRIATRSRRALHRAVTYGALHVNDPNSEWPEPLYTCEPLALYHDLSAQQGAVSLAGHVLAVGAGKLITVVDLNTGATLCKSPRSGRVRCVALSSGGNLLISGSFDSTLEMVDLTAGARLHHHRTTDTVRSVSFSADAKFFAVGSEMPGGGRVRLYDGVSDTLLATWRHAAAVWAVSLQGEGGLLAAAGFDGKLTLYCTATLMPLQAIEYPAPQGLSFVWALRWCEDGSSLALGCWNHRAYIYQLRKNHVRWRRAYECAIKYTQLVNSRASVAEVPAAAGLSRGASGGAAQVAVAPPAPCLVNPSTAPRDDSRKKKVAVISSEPPSVAPAFAPQAADELSGNGFSTFAPTASASGDESSVPPVALSRGSSSSFVMAETSERSSRGNLRSRAPVAEPPAATSFRCRSSSGVAYSGGVTSATSVAEGRAYASLLSLRAVIVRPDKVYAVAPNADASKLFVASRDRTVAMLELPEADGKTEDTAAAPRESTSYMPSEDRRRGTGPALSAAPLPAPRVDVAAMRAEKVGAGAAVLFEKRTDDLVYSVAISPDERVCAYGGRSMNVLVLDAVSGRQLFYVSTSGSIWSVRLLDYSTSPAANPQLKMLYGGEFPHITVIDVNSRKEELHMPVAEGTYGVDLTTQALAYTNGMRASVYGRPGAHYAWHDPPSFHYVSQLLLKQQQRLTTDNYVDLVRNVVQRHPAIVNLKDPTSGVSLVQLAVEGSCHPRIVECLLRVDCRVGLQPNLRGLTAIDTALQLGDASALRALLGALLSGRFSPSPAGMRLVTDAFEALATKYPHEFLHFVSSMPLHSEPEVFLSETQNVRLPHNRPFLVGGDEARCPRGLWEDVLHKYRMEFQEEFAALLQQVVRRNAAAVTDASPNGSVSSGTSLLGGSSGELSLKKQTSYRMQKASLMRQAALAEQSVAHREELERERTTQMPSARMAATRAEGGAKRLRFMSLSGKTGGADRGLPDGEDETRTSGLPGVAACRRASMEAIFHKAAPATAWRRCSAPPAMTPQQLFAQQVEGARDDDGDEDTVADPPGGAQSNRLSAAMRGETEGKQDGKYPRTGFVRVQSGGLQALRIPFEHFAGDPKISKSLFELAHEESRPSPLELVVRAVDATRNYQVFDSIPIKILLTYKWVGFAQRLFYNDLVFFMIHLALTVVFISMSSTKFDIWFDVLLDFEEELDGDRRARLVDNVALLVLWFLTSLISLVNLIYIFGKRRLAKHFVLSLLSDAQKLVNVLYNLGQLIVNVWLLILVGFLNQPSTFVLLQAGNDTRPSFLYNLTVAERVASQSMGAGEFANPAVNICQSMVCLLLFARMIFYFRGFISFGALVFIVVEIFTTMFPFLLFVLVATTGFTLSSQVLMQHLYPEDVTWTSQTRPLFYLLNYGLRFAPPNAQLLDTAAEHSYIGVVYFLFMGCVQLILTNLLVAIMSNRLGQLRGNERLMASHVRAKLVLDLEQALLSRILYNKRSGDADSLKSRTRRRIDARSGIVLLVTRLRARVGLAMQWILQLVFAQEKLPEMQDVRPRWLHVLLPSEQAAAEATSAKTGHGSAEPPPMSSSGGDESSRLLQVERTLEDLRTAVERSNNDVLAKVIGAVEKAIDDKFGQAAEAAQDQMVSSKAMDLTRMRSPAMLHRSSTRSLGRSAMPNASLELIPGTTPSAAEPNGFASFVGSLFHAPPPLPTAPATSTSTSAHPSSTHGRRRVTVMAPAPSASRLQA